MSFVLFPAVSTFILSSCLSYAHMCHLYSQTNKLSFCYRVTLFQFIMCVIYCCILCNFVVVSALCCCIHCQYVIVFVMCVICCCIANKQTNRKATNCHFVFVCHLLLYSLSMCHRVCYAVCISHQLLIRLKLLLLLKYKSSLLVSILLNLSNDLLSCQTFTNDLQQMCEGFVSNPYKHCFHRPS